MSGCSAHNNGGDSSAGFKRVVTWIGGGLMLSGMAFAIIASILGGFSLAGLASAFLLGAVLGLFIGFAVDYFSKLKKQDPEQITISGTAKCAGKNDFGFFTTDGDWTCNIGDLRFIAPSDLPVTAPGAMFQIDEVRLRAAPGSGLAHAFPSFNADDFKVPILHCEISSHIGSYGALGGAIGSVAGAGIGAAVGYAVGAAVCAALAVVTFGIALIACVIAAIAIGAALGAAAGGLLGEFIGGVTGWIVDEVSDFDKLGKTIESNQNCLLFITGSWVTDTSHQHNEIHDIEAVQLVGCPGFAGPPLTPQTVGVVAIGRQPAGNGGQIR